MNICMILDGRDFETDDRVRSEASRLARDEHHVLVVCDHAPDRASRETINGVEIVRLSGGPPSLRFFNQLCGALLLFRRPGPAAPRADGPPQGDRVELCADRAHALGDVGPTCPPCGTGVLGGFPPHGL